MTENNLEKTEATNVIKICKQMEKRNLKTVK